MWSANEMGGFFYSRGAYDLAISEFKRALKLLVFPVPQGHMNLGAAFLEKKMCAEAEAEGDQPRGLSASRRVGRVALCHVMATGRLTRRSASG
jgi:Tfp pilus assembly protein PilF